jgi:L-seryl-tRNA(Ser) seleniumtransferase
VTALRGLPSVDAVLRAAPRSLVSTGRRPRFVAAVRETLAAARRDASGGRGLPDTEAIVREARERLERAERPTLVPVINATGVILHTNLGRAALAPEAVDAIRRAAGAVSVEYDLEEGRRGERHVHARRLLAELSGAQDALVANNNAAAVLLALAALAKGKEVLVARGELIEIGGSFRIPDVLRQSGAKLVEVGTTNRTYLRDYAEAITPRTAVILRAHASNFRVVGFTHAASDRELAALARERGLTLLHDLGSGTFLDTARFGLAHEQTVAEAVAAGADIVTFSGDKLLGGPQAGLAVGRTELIDRLRRHPFMRAVRPDKLTLAALVATLELYRDGRATERVPVWRMIAARPAALARRAKAIASALTAAGAEARAVSTESTIGGGSLPEETQPSRGVALIAKRPQELARALRRAQTPVIGRIVEDDVVLDLRSVLPEDDERLLRAVSAAVR